MKISVYMDEAYHAFADVVTEQNARWAHQVDVPDEWAKRYFAARREFEKLTEELDDHWDASRKGASA